MVWHVVGSPHEDRDARVAELAAMGFTWADIEEEKYWIDQLVTMDRKTHDELMDASQILWNIFDKAARFVIGKEDLYQVLSIPEVLWDGLDWLDPNEFGQMSRYARFDFAIGHDGNIKLLELNADTPTGYVESSVVTPWMCKQYEKYTTNNEMASLVRDAWAVEQPEYVACVSYGQHLEDTGTVDMLAKHSGLDIKMIDCLDLWVDEGVLKDANGIAIKRLFALYPKEWMAIDDGGEAFAYSIENRHVELFNSLHAIILQSKGLQALIWGLHELEVDLFDEKEHDYIERFMLPTYNKPIFDHSYVSKSMFGREGGSVQMFDTEGQLDVQDTAGVDTSQFFSRVYQKRADLPHIELASGSFHLLTGVFVIHGKPCGLLGRAGGLITGNSSHFVAIGVNEHEAEDGSTI
ncbi:glutathionylspermidine synthase family protein [Paenibacillus sp. N1-5-1-14]|uniref:glutathionylspermidine synthase family protein n=1 Tax=Paenibacillus radicibacter TaxID=2972488 RepID=UPI00215944AF|nr:glutathionylspermidine synthase family protein [Paenibacillus radicibacter]MCR8642497.1 glutathionylspermidine synthase family protein [Paenibacillus radicibacter]